jgi:MscS family membrane protein
MPMPPAPPRARRRPAAAAASALTLALVLVLSLVAPRPAYPQEAPPTEGEAPTITEGSGLGTGLDLGLAPPAVRGWGDGLDAWMADHAAPLAQPVLGNAAWRYLATAFTLALFLLLRRLLAGAVARWAQRLTRNTRTDLDDRVVIAFLPPLRFLVALLGVVLGVSWLELAPWAQTAVSVLWRLGVVVTLVWVALGSVGILVRLLSGIAGQTESDLDDRLVPLVARIARVVIIGLGAVFILEQLGFNVGAMLAGLGVGGLALALAAQDTMANWFGALMIYTDRPFREGDWIKTSSVEGVVEEIGLRSTRVRSFGKTLITVPNRDLASSHIENFSERPVRRVDFTVGLTYSTTPDMMRESVARMRDVLREHPEVDQSFWLVKFTGFGDSSLNVLVYFFTLTTDWNRYLDIREDINLRFMETLAEIGVEMAFPSTSVYLEKPDPTEVARLDEQARRMFRARRQVVDERERMTAPSPETADGV